MNCIVVDDNKMARTALKQLIHQVDFLVLIAECESPIAAFNYLQQETVDILFLDVEMPGMTGIELIKTLDNCPVVILITSKPEYAVTAFELNVADYIVKPVTLARFITAVTKAKELVAQRKHKVTLKTVPVNDAEYIFVRANAVLTKIKIACITYVQALGDYVTIYTTTNRYTVHITLKGITQKLPTNSFYRLHRSYLVALHHIDKVEDGTAYIGKHPIPIGEQYKKELLQKINLI